jgi:glycosidase
MTGSDPAARTRSRRVLVALGMLAGVAIVALAIGLVPRQQEPPRASGLAVLEPDLEPAAIDGHINLADLQHDSRDDLYRTPVGAVPAGTTVTLRLRATAGDLSRAQILVHDTLRDTRAVLDMSVAATDRTAGAHGYDYWQASLETASDPTVVEYQFVARDGDAVRYLSDDAALDGGTGNLYGSAPDASWQITAYDPAFTTPAWTRGAVAYQIFPDRFFNADPANDPDPGASPGPGPAGQYAYGDVYGNEILPKAWDEKPEGYCRAYQGTTCAESPLGRDFFGGDLAGIAAHLDELQDLGVTVLYLNPIFGAPSNHRYDTSDYMVIDPDLGTQADFDALVAGLKERGMRLILDGVFNHVSSDSPWFDRSRRFPTTGACESPTSPFRSWFTFRAPSGNEPAPCAPTTATSGDTYYVGWFGFDTIPELQEIPAVDQLITGDQGVVRHWLGLGMNGWRLDVMDNLSDDLLRQIRSATKLADPDALVLGEQWGDSSRWLLGDEADSVMNYRFRRAVIGLVNGPTADLDGSIDGLAPTQFAAQMKSVVEDYPGPAFEALLNLVDSHDTTRILWTLTPGAENEAAKTAPDALAVGLVKLRQVATLQFTWPGIADVYYGDEVGLTGQDDPDDRRPYPWGNEDADLRAFYRMLGQLRAGHEALRTGDLRFLLADDDADTLAFSRATDAEVAVTILNLADEARSVTVDVANLIPNGAVLRDGLGGADATVADGMVTVQLGPRASAVLLTAAGLDLQAPSRPAAPAAANAGRAVDLQWPAVDGAASYRVYRSLVAGGGFQAVADVTDPAYRDGNVRPGTPYHYAVAALDGNGNASMRSEEVVAVPRITVDTAVMETAANLQQPVSAIAGAPVAVRVAAPGATEGQGAAVGLRVQAGFGTVGSDPGGTGWTWSELRWAKDVDGADQFSGDVRPEAPGAYAVLARLSTDGGATWSVLDREGLPGTSRAATPVRLEAVAASDTVAPPAPGSLEVAASGPSSITLRWAPVEAPDIYRYVVWRAEADSDDFVQVGVTGSQTYTDEAVQPGTDYRYEVTAQDSSFNASGFSPVLTASAERRQVQVTFTVEVPGGTPPKDAIFIAGDFQGWNPGASPMTRVDDHTWTITIAFDDAAQPQYKFTRGSWEAVEKDAGCGEIPNRTITVDFGAGGTQTVADTVAKWRDVDHCG